MRVYIIGNDGIWFRGALGRAWRAGGIVEISRPILVKEKGL
jgi:hypothetical protein